MITGASGTFVSFLICKFLLNIYNSISYHSCYSRIYFLHRFITCLVFILVGIGCFWYDLYGTWVCLLGCPNFSCFTPFEFHFFNAVNSILEHCLFCALITWLWFYELLNLINFLGYTLFPCFPTIWHHLLFCLSLFLISLFLQLYIQIRSLNFCDSIYCSSLSWS